MADGIVFCKECKEQTDHTHIKGRTCVCSRCGTVNLANNPGKIEANVEARKAAALASLAAASVIGIPGDIPDEQQETKPDQRAELYEKIKGDKTMAKLTAENRADIIRRHEAGESDSVLAADFGVCPGTITYTCRKSGKAKAGRKGKRAVKAEAGELSGPTLTPRAGNPIRDMIAREVSGHLSDLDRRIDMRVREVLAEMLK